MTVEIVYPAFNRLRFTQTSWRCLIENTDWASVDRLVVYDDGSSDGTREWLDQHLGDCPVEAELIYLGMHSPVAVMNHAIAEAKSEWFAKIDNDICVPPGWLEAMLTVRKANPDADLIGAEAGMTAVPGRDGEPWDGEYLFLPSSHIGGVGLMRAAAFGGRRMTPNGRYGFTEAQQEWDLARGWITPDLAVIQLDRLPFDPWLALSRDYLEAGWQRDWPKYDKRWMAWAWEPFVGQIEGAA